MSWADFALVPAGGRRSTKSRLAYVSRSVQFDAPPAYCVTASSPSRPGRSARGAASTGRAWSSAPFRTAPEASSIGSPLRVAALCQLDPRNEPFVPLIGPIGEPKRPRLRIEGGERRIVGQPRRAVDLNGMVDDPLERVRRDDLHGRDLGPAAESTDLVDLPPPVQPHQTSPVTRVPPLRDPL